MGKNKTQTIAVELKISSLLMEMNRSLMEMSAYGHPLGEKLHRFANELNQLNSLTPIYISTILNTFTDRWPHIYFPGWYLMCWMRACTQEVLESWCVSARVFKGYSIRLTFYTERLKLFAMLLIQSYQLKYFIEASRISERTREHCSKALRTWTVTILQRYLITLP